MYIMKLSMQKFFIIFAEFFTTANSCMSLTFMCKYNKYVKVNILDYLPDNEIFYLESFMIHSIL